MRAEVNEKEKTILQQIIKEITRMSKEERIKLMYITQGINLCKEGK